MKQRSFSRVVYEGTINGPEHIPVDHKGDVLQPQTDTLTRMGDVEYEEVRTHAVHSVSGQRVGKVTDYQQVGFVPELTAIGQQATLNLHE